MQVKELVKRLCRYGMDSPVYFETKGENQGGESEIFPLDIESIYQNPSDEGPTIRLQDN